MELKAKDLIKELKTVGDFRSSNVVKFRGRIIQHDFAPGSWVACVIVSADSFPSL